MPSKIKTLKEQRARRHRRLRRKIRGTAVCPRLCIAVSNRWIRVQLVDDDAARTLASLCSSKLDGDQAGKTIDAARRLGREAGRLALAQGIKNVVCDRGGRKYHGRIKALAEAAREAGLIF